MNNRQRVHKAREIDAANGLDLAGIAQLRDQPGCGRLLHLPESLLVNTFRVILFHRSLRSAFTG